jgi:hypothetical protein
MSEYSVYPAQLDGYAQLPLAKDKLTPVDAESANRLRDAIVKIQKELGVLPSSTYTDVAARLDDIEQNLNILLAEGEMQSDDQPTQILSNVALGTTLALGTLTNTVNVRNFKEIDFVFTCTNLGSITEIRFVIIYSVLQNPQPYNIAPQDWIFLMAENVVSGISTVDPYTISLDATVYPGFASLPGSFGFRSPVSGLHMGIIAWAEAGSPAGSGFSATALRRI